MNQGICSSAWWGPSQKAPLVLLDSITMTPAHTWNDGIYHKTPLSNEQDEILDSWDQFIFIVKTSLVLPGKLPCIFLEKRKSIFYEEHDAVIYLYFHSFSKLHNIIPI